MLLWVSFTVAQRYFLLNFDTFRVQVCSTAVLQYFDVSVAVNRTSLTFTFTTGVHPVNYTRSFNCCAPTDPFPFENLLRPGHNNLSQSILCSNSELKLQLKLFTATDLLFIHQFTVL